MANIPDIVEDIVQSFRRDIATSGLTDRRTVYSCPDLYAYDGMTVVGTFTSASDPLGVDLDVIIEAIDRTAKTITFADAVDLSPYNDCINVRLPLPFYDHGTPLMVQPRWSNLSDDVKYPMVYLFERIREVEQSRQSSLDTVADLTMLFAINANYKDWNTDQHYQNAIDVMRRYYDEFRYQLDEQSSKFYQYEENYALYSHANFGVYMDRKGHTQRIFAENISGVELNFTLNVRKCKCVNCNCNCN